MKLHNIEHLITPYQRLSAAKKKKIRDIPANGSYHGYVRILTIGPLKNGPTISQQIFDINKYVSSRGKKLVDVYVETSLDEDYISRDSQLGVVLEKMNSGDTLIVKSVGHLTVSSHDFISIRTFLFEKGCFLEFVDNRFDQRDGPGKFATLMTVALIEMEYDKGASEEPVE